MSGEDTSAPETLRLDKWLWHARMFKTRTLAAKVCASGRVRVNGTLVAKPHHALRAGDVLTLPVGARIRVLRVLAMGSRRGPAPEARQLYDDLSPPLEDPLPDAPNSSADPGAGPTRETGPEQPPDHPPRERPPREHLLAARPSGPQARRLPGSGRPTKADRRAVDRLREQD